MDSLGTDVVAGSILGSRGMIDAPLFTICQLWIQPVRKNKNKHNMTRELYSFILSKRIWDTQREIFIFKCSTLGIFFFWLSPPVTIHTIPEIMRTTHERGITPAKLSNTDTSNHNQTSLLCAVMMKRWRQKILSRLWSNHAFFANFFHIFAFGNSRTAATCLFRSPQQQHVIKQERWGCWSVRTATDLTCELVVTSRRGDAEVRGCELSHKYGGWVDSEGPRVACGWDRDR